MSDFERARRQIEEDTQTFEERKVDELKKEHTQKESDLLQESVANSNYSANFTFLSKSLTPFLLQARNELFSGKGQIKPWHKTQHRIYGKEDRGGDISPKYWPIIEGIAGFESSLVVPTYGKITIGLPIKRFRMDASSIPFMDWVFHPKWKTEPKTDRSVSISGTASELKPSISMIQDPDVFCSRLRQEIINLAVALHKHKLSR